MDPNTASYQGGGLSAPPPAKRTSPWVYVGCGCALALVIGALAVFFIGKGVMRSFKHMAQDMADPRMREQRTREMLGYTTLPDGYYAGGAISVPLISDMAFLTDRQPEAGASAHGGPMEFDQRGFMFMKILLARIPAGDDARRHLLDKNGQSPWNSSVRIDANSTLGEGDLQAGGAHVYYRATRGDVTMNRNHHHGLVTPMLIGCPDNRMRLGIWSGPDPDPDASDGQLNRAGTPADPKAIAAFLDHFTLCTGGS